MLVVLMTKEEWQEIVLNLLEFLYRQKTSLQITNAHHGKAMELFQRYKSSPYSGPATLYLCNMFEVLHSHKELPLYFDNIKRTAEVEELIEMLFPGSKQQTKSDTKSIPETLNREPEVKLNVTHSITSEVKHIPTINGPTMTNGNQSKQIDTPTIIVLDSSNESKLEAASNHLLLCSELAVDCEGVNMSETGILCLVQIAAPAKVPGNISCAHSY
jgi:hypothetical protein